MIDSWYDIIDSLKFHSCLSLNWKQTGSYLCHESYQIINKGINFAATKQLSKLRKTKIFNTESTHTAVAAATKSNQELYPVPPIVTFF